MAALARHSVRQPSLLVDLPDALRHRGKSALDLQQPWWPYSAARTVAARLSDSPKRVFEFGAGGSTIWLSALGAHITSVEHDSAWYGQIRPALPSTVRLILAEPAKTGSIASDAASGYFDDYVSCIDDIENLSLDLVVVDGRARVASALAAIPKVRPGGMLLLDDSDRPRYGEAHRRLSAWPHDVIRGLKPGGGLTVFETTIWRRPSPRPREDEHWSGGTKDTP